MAGGMAGLLACGAGLMPAGFGLAVPGCGRRTGVLLVLDGCGLTF